MKKILFIFLCFITFIKAEEKKLKFFVLDMHSGATEDAAYILRDLGHEVTVWSISNNSQFVYKKANDQVEVINRSTFHDLNFAMCDQFYNHYKNFLDQFDAFLVTTSSSFVPIYIKSNKPIIVINSTRYEMPFTNRDNVWNELNGVLKKGVKSNQLFIIANNKADAKYLKYYTGIDSEVIPSLSLYVGLQYTGQISSYFAHPYRFFYEMPNLIIEKMHNPNLVTSLGPGFSYNNAYDHKGIIHIPYQISTMSIFEQYSANIPLFFPTKEFAIKLRREYPWRVLPECSLFFWYQRPHSNILGDPNNLNDPEVIKFWLDNADFYDGENMPYIQYFESFEHLEHLLNTVDVNEISRMMKQYNLKRKRLVYQKWKEVLARVASQVQQ